MPQSNFRIEGLFLEELKVFSEPLTNAARALFPPRLRFTERPDFPKLDTRWTTNRVGLPRGGGPALKALPFATTCWKNSTPQFERPARSCARARDGAARHLYRLIGSRID
ncbi:MAG TPA: hypothetical protein DCE44_05765 [Verrucomicrobiales bacterium]|nr:hypothetical protein [Verrucomicrobiales bacterium]